MSSSFSCASLALRRVVRGCTEFWHAWFTWRSSLVVALLTVCGFWLFGGPLALDDLDPSSPLGLALRATLAFELAMFYTIAAVIAFRALRNDGIRRLRAWCATATGRSKIAKDLQALRSRLELLEHRSVSLGEWDELVATAMDLDTDFRVVDADAAMGVPYARIVRDRRRVAVVYNTLRDYLNSDAARAECFAELGLAELDSTPSALCAVTVRLDATALDKAVLLAYATVGELPFDELYPLRYRSTYLIYAPEKLLHAWSERESDLEFSDIAPCPSGAVDLAQSLWSRDNESIYHDPVRLVAAASRLDRASQHRP